MRRRLSLAMLSVVAMSGAVLAGAPAATAAAPEFQHLTPGGQPQLVERLPVNVVLVGYDAPAVDGDALVGGLPKQYEPVVRSRLSYGEVERLGITYDYDYHVQYTGRSYEDRFFSKLKQLSTRAPLTAYQKEYNAQDGNNVVVRGNHEIDAPSVEEWLAENAPKGIDTRRNTVFLINWYGRSDFEHHVYTKTGEADPDTGYDFGKERDSRKLVAWGGTTRDDEESGLGSTRRVWFHDLSAGPESWSGSYNVDDADIDGDGEPDYRLPPVWEYARNGYRSPARLTADLRKLVRYVALDLLFTPSPLYPVELPTEEPPTSINIDENTYEGWPGVNASKRYITRKLLTSELSELMTRKELSYDNQDLPYRGAAKECYVKELAGTSCYPELGYPSFANLFLQNTFQLDRTRDDQGSTDYELPVFSYVVPRGTGVPALGYADDDYRTGTQSYVFAFLSPEVVESGYGLTTSIIHEVGHHVGLSHPHDGYDSASGVDFGPSGDFFFAWAGDEVNSMMSYIDLNWDFSQFDRDDMNRFQTAAQIEAANRLAAEALAAERPAASYADLREADRLVGRAETAFAEHRYGAAFAAAEHAYRLAAAGARKAGVDVERTTAALRATQEAAREAGEVHQPGEFVDTLTEGPRNQP